MNIYIPYTITAVQGKIQLDRQGLTEQISQIIELSSYETKIYWEYATVWEFNSQLLRKIANQLEWTENQLIDFFVEANKI